VLILLLTAVFGMILFAGFFFRAYQTFTYEEPVAKITVEPGDEPETNKITLVQFGPEEKEIVRQFRLSGDQWMLEGDILKWNNWMNFLGLHTRYRLTRLRGRYTEIEDEKVLPSTIYPLVENEDHPLWRYFYRHGFKLPLVSTAYGNAVFQYSDKGTSYLVYVGTSGFIVRKQNETLQ